MNVRQRAGRRRRCAGCSPPPSRRRSSSGLGTAQLRCTRRARRPAGGRSDRRRRRRRHRGRRHPHPYATCCGSGSAPVARSAHLLQDRPRLEGLADVGGRGLAIVVSGVGARPLPGLDGLGGARPATLAALRTRRPRGARRRAGLVDGLGRRPPAVRRHPRPAPARRRPRRGRRADVVAARRPATSRPSRRRPLLGPHVVRAAPVCGPGQDWAFDVGPHGDLPALLPDGDDRPGPTAAARRSPAARGRCATSTRTSTPRPRRTT